MRGSTSERAPFGEGGDGDWMHELAVHYERMRRAYPDDELCVVFDIDGTILDMRFLVTHVLFAYDREHGTEHFAGLRPEEVAVHENRIDDFLGTRMLPATVRRDVREWYRSRLWSRDAILAGSRAHPGVLGVIRWFQLQPRTSVALNTGRPEGLRAATIEALNGLGRVHRVAFDDSLLFMNPLGWERDVPAAKVRGLEALRERGLRVVAVVDNEPANIRAMAGADLGEEILFLHADTIFESEREPMPRTVSGSRYGLAALVSETDLRRRVEFVWHGVNDEANLRHFLGSDVRWAEGDVRCDPLGRLVFRHDSFDESPWSRSERMLLLTDCLERLREAGRALQLDLKEGDDALERVLDTVRASGLEDEQLWFAGTIETLGERGIRLLATSHPGAVVSVPVDFLGPLAAAAPSLATLVLDALRGWGVNRLSLSWISAGVRDLMDLVERNGWRVNLYGVPDLESFLEASLLAPASITADFNFPDWDYFGRGSGHRHAYHRYTLVTAD